MCLGGEITSGEVTLYEKVIVLKAVPIAKLDLL